MLLYFSLNDLNKFEKKTNWTSVSRISIKIHLQSSRPILILMATLMFGILKHCLLFSFKPDQDRFLLYGLLSAVFRCGHQFNGGKRFREEFYFVFFQLKTRNLFSLLISCLGNKIFIASFLSNPRGQYMFLRIFH